MRMEIGSLFHEAKSLGLFQPHSATEVHCANCQARLNPQGNCSTCGLIGQSEAALRSRADTDAAGVEKLLQESLSRRNAYRPIGKR